MEESIKKENKKKEKNKKRTFPVPFGLELIKENITITSKARSNPPKEQIINQAIDFHQQGNTSEAAKFYKYCINRGFNDPTVFSNYGIILRSLGNIKEAERLTRKSIELNSQNADFHLNLGNILIDLGKLKEAESSQRNAIKLNPSLAMAHNNLGNTLKDLGKLQEAETSCRKAIEINPDFAIAHSNLGNILIDLGKLKEAELSCRKAIQLNPDFAEAHSSLANILNKNGQLKEAELSCRKAIQLNPNNAKLHLNLGNILKDLDQLQEAEHCWTKAVELDPKIDIAVRNLAKYLFDQKKYDQAIHYLEKNESDNCQSLYLGFLLSLDKEKEFNQKYLQLSKKNVCNSEIGAISEHANIIYNNIYKSTFCNQSINYILIEKIEENLFSRNDLNLLISFFKNHETFYPQGLLKNGSQTFGNLFRFNYPFIKSIRDALEIKIENYKNKFKYSGQGFIRNWPEKYEIRSWIVGMKSGGFLKPHNHDYAWISGSFYLQVPKTNEHANAGNIAFGYQSPHFPNKGNDFNLDLKKIETRDICIFPSSLYHHTIPFQSEEERICFVFDLIKKD